MEFYEKHSLIENTSTFIQWELLYISGSHNIVIAEHK